MPREAPLVLGAMTLIAPAAQPPARPVHDVPGFAWEFTVTYDGDTHWLECDRCSQPVTSVEAGDSAESMFAKLRDHERACTGARHP